MFEFSIARKYLIPKKRQLSLALIAIMSVGVISLVVWLVLLFLSVTEGIEKNWLTKLTSLNAPITITPKRAYYNSYYYQIDSIASESDYSLKSIREKLESPYADPYLIGEDMEIPAYFGQNVLNADGSPKDLVKEVFSHLEMMKEKDPSLIASDYEMSGALMKLNLLRPVNPTYDPRAEKIQTHLTQVAYITSFTENSPHLHALIEPPSMQDLNHLLFLNPLSSEKILEKVLANIEIQRMKSVESTFILPHAFFPENEVFNALVILEDGRVSHVVMGNHPEKIVRKGDTLYALQGDGTSIAIDKDVPIFPQQPLSFQVLEHTADLVFKLQGTLQGKEIGGEHPLEGLEIEEATVLRSFDKAPKIAPLWPYEIKGKGYVLPEDGVLIPKHFQKSDVLLGDKGHLSYGATTPSAVQEQRLGVYVAGFYDPGIMAIGAKALLVPPRIAHMVNLSSHSMTLDQTLSNGIRVWFDSLDHTDRVKHDLEIALQDSGLSPYWTVTSFKEYDFAKDLFQQFQSDKYLFTLIGGIILLVACSNIISLLVLLVNDKKREIAIMQAMGASKKSIALVFALCGGIMGLVSTLIGAVAAYFTLSHLDTLVHFLSVIQGHDAFNATFYGNSLPNQMSSSALIFILIATPIISVIAGLIPAMKACKYHPSQILRGEA